MKASARSTTRGFTLIEAIVALLVVAFGMLAIAGFQMNLSRGSDVAKQRTEATRLAQQKIEELRSFERIASAPGLFAYANLASSTDTVASTNTDFTREWSVSGAATALQRTVSVTVSWIDRAGAPENVNLITVISKSDPADAGSLGVPPIENGVLVRPKNRNVNIPIRAASLGGANSGRSIGQWYGASGGYLVFSDATGAVIGQCASAPGDDTDLSTCSTPTRYLLSGFLSGAWVASVPNNGVSIDPPTQLTGAAPECLVQDARDQNDDSIVIPGFKVYVCLIQPVDHDSSPTTPLVWSGRPLFQPATGSRVVCRFVGNQNNAASTPPGTHLLVRESIDNQNYLLKDPGPCDAGTVQHQP